MTSDSQPWVLTALDVAEDVTYWCNGIVVITGKACPQAATCARYQGGLMRQAAGHEDDLPHEARQAQRYFRRSSCFAVWGDDDEDGGPP